MLRSDAIALLAAGLVSRRRSAFADAVDRIRMTIAADDADPAIAKAALPRLYHHGKPVANAVVLFHGFTNCPQQFDELARSLFARGCNVYVPRLPYHGYRDRLTKALAAQTAHELAEATSRYYRLTAPLGRRVTALGLSLGGTMALALAQSTAVDHAIAVAPFLMPIGVPSAVGAPVMTALDRLPDFYVWWDPRMRERCPPMYAYPGFPMHALAEIVLFGETVTRAAHDATRPLGRRCTLVTNSVESAVNSSVARDLVATWQAHGAPYDAVEIDGLGSPRHDIIDPSTFPAARTRVYPFLEALVLA
jgi:dienelactone hydrolase